jgi:hypothetical protein
MEVFKAKNWKELNGNRKEWNKLVEKVKTHPGLKEKEKKKKRRRKKWKKKK